MDAGYSGTPQAEKRGPGVRWDLVAASPEWRFATEPDAAIRAHKDEPADAVSAFVHEKSEIVPTIERPRDRIFPAGALWLS